MVLIGSVVIAAITRVKARSLAKSTINREAIHGIAQEISACNRLLSHVRGMYVPGIVLRSVSIPKPSKSLAALGILNSVGTF